MEKSDEEAKAQERMQDLPNQQLKSAGMIIKEITGSIKELSTVYERIGFAGMLTVSAIALISLTIVLSFYTETILMQEKILFSWIAIALAVLATVFLVQKNSKESRRELLAMEIERERNRWIHEETMAKLNMEGSARKGHESQSGPHSYTRGNELSSGWMPTL